MWTGLPPKPLLTTALPLDRPPLSLQHRTAKDPDYGPVWLFGLGESAMFVKLLHVYSWTLMTGLGEAVSRMLTKYYAPSCVPLEPLEKGPAFEDVSL